MLIRLAALLVLALIPTIGHAQPGAAFQVGANFPSWWNGNYLTPDSTASLKSLAAIHAQVAVIVPTHYVDTKSSSTIAATAQTESDANVIRAIQDARAAGLAVVLKPHIDVADWSFRGFILPADTAAWFANYKALIVNYAAIAQAQGVTILSVGTELQSVTGPAFRAQWLDVIAAVRGVYHGALTYSAYVGEARAVSFWDRLNYIGVDLYPVLSLAPNPTVAELVAAWRQPSPDANYNQNLLGGASPYEFLRGLSAANHKPLLLTEIGFASAAGAAGASPDTGTPDPAAQANLYDAFFQFWRPNAGNWMVGAFLWEWTPVADPGDASNYTVAHKPAAATIARWLHARH